MPGYKSRWPPLGAAILVYALFKHRFEIIDWKLSRMRGGFFYAHPAGMAHREGRIAAD
jgi:hypothetical protein